MKVIVKHDKTKATLQRGLQNQRHLNGAQTNDPKVQTAVRHSTENHRNTKTYF